MLTLKSKVTRALAIGLIGLAIPVLAGAKAQRSHHSTGAVSSHTAAPSKSAAMSHTTSHSTKLSTRHASPSKLSTKSHTMSKTHKSTKLTSSKKKSTLHSAHPSHGNLTQQHRTAKAM